MSDLNMLLAITKLVGVFVLVLGSLALSAIIVIVTVSIAYFLLKRVSAKPNEDSKRPRQSEMGVTENTSRIWSWWIGGSKDENN